MQQFSGDGDTRRSGNGETMNTIYIVTSGEYSDYRIVGVFSTKEIAQLAIGAGHGDEIEEYEIDKYADYARRGIGAYRVHIGIDNADIHTIRAIDMADTTDEEKEPSPSFDGQSLIVLAYATDERHAAKIAMEKRAMWIASQ